MLPCCPGQAAKPRRKTATAIFPYHKLYRWGIPMSVAATMGLPPAERVPPAAGWRLTQSGLSPPFQRADHARKVHGQDADNPAENEHHRQL